MPLSGIQYLHSVVQPAALCSRRTFPSPQQEPLQPLVVTPHPPSQSLHCRSGLAASGCFTRVELRESIPTQVDKKPGIPEEEKGVWGFQGERGLQSSRRRKGQTSFFFSLHSLVLVKNVFFFKREPVITQQTTQFKLCAKDYKTTMYPA